MLNVFKFLKNITVQNIIFLFHSVLNLLFLVIIAMAYLLNNQYDNYFLKKFLYLKPLK